MVMSLLKQDGESVLLQHVPFASDEPAYGPLTTVVKRLDARMMPKYMPKGPFFENKYPSLKRVPALTLMLLPDLTKDDLVLPPTVFPHVLKHALNLVQIFLWRGEMVNLVTGLPKLTDQRLLPLLRHKQKLAALALPLAQ